MGATKLNTISSTEYLTIERSAKEKHELHQGKIVAMAGASFAHNEIVANLFGDIKTFLKGNDCRVYPSDLRVYVPMAETFTYPDLSVICGKPEMVDGQFDTVLNPSIIIEVMSPSTEAYDRGTKFFYYMQLASLKEYVLVSSTSVYIQRALRQADGSWKFEEIMSIDGALSFSTIQHRISVADVYENVTL
jgi:Uma2 family endonuclease